MACLIVLTMSSGMENGGSSLRRSYHRTGYEAIHKVAAPLVGRGKITNRKFVEQHQRELNYIANGWNILEKTYADTKSYQKARVLVEQLGAEFG